MNKIKEKWQKWFVIPLLRLWNTKTEDKGGEK